MRVRDRVTFAQGDKIMENAMRSATNDAHEFLKRELASLGKMTSALVLASDVYKALDTKDASSRVSEASDKISSECARAAPGRSRRRVRRKPASWPGALRSKRRRRL